MQINTEINNNKPVVTPKMLASKFRSKGELHSFLCVDCSAYMPPMPTINIYFLKSLISGQLKCK